MASCLGCGKGMVEVSRKIVKDEAAGGRSNCKVIFHCKNNSCSQKGQKIGFLDDGIMMIPLPDGQ